MIPHLLKQQIFRFGFLIWTDFWTLKRHKRLQLEAGDRLTTGEESWNQRIETINAQVLMKNLL